MAGESKIESKLSKLLRSKDIDTPSDYSLNSPPFRNREHIDARENDQTTTAVVKINLERIPSFKKLNELQAWGARMALTTMQLAVNEGYIDANHLKRIADFGAGGGGPTFALTEIAKATGGQVIAIEANPRFAASITEYEILPQDQVRVEDGLEHLEQIKEKNGVGYDLVTSFMLGPDMSGNLFRNLAHASAKGLSDNGNLLVTSEGGTFSVAHDICKSSGVPYTFIHGINAGENMIMLNTLIIPKSSCTKLR